VRQLVARLGAAATGSLLEALASEQDQFAPAPAVST
jgi:hypothetical protein